MIVTKETQKQSLKLSDKKKDTKKDQKRNEYYAHLWLIKIFELNEYPYAI